MAAGKTIFVISLLCTDKFYDESANSAGDLSRATRYASYAAAQAKCSQASSDLRTLFVEVRQTIEYPRL